MPQLKKLSVLPNSILPKVELGLESVYTTYAGSFQDSSYLSLFSDMKSQILSSDLESDGADSVTSKPRKRQRLDHLSQEEKIMRRKMKNRVAAQTARDRKKARMAELEDQVIELETERKMLILANMDLQSKNSSLKKENDDLKFRLGEKCISEDEVKKESSNVQEESITVDSAESRLSDSSGSLEHAEGTGSANSYSLDDAIRLLTTNSETDDLLDLLQQCSEDLLQCEELDSPPMPEFGDTRKTETSASEMVGAPSKCMESNKELIHFDHIYYKHGDELTGSSDPSLSAQGSELSTKDCHIDIPTQLDSDCLIEIDNSSEIPIICISESSNSGPAGDILQFSESFCYPRFGDHIVTVNDSKPVPSPVSSDAGYDSSFSDSSPSSCAANPWDDTLTELFPTLV